MFSMFLDVVPFTLRLGLGYITLLYLISFFVSVDSFRPNMFKYDWVWVLFLKLM